MTKIKLGIKEYPDKDAREGKVYVPYIELYGNVLYFEEKITRSRAENTLQYVQQLIRHAANNPQDYTLEKIQNQLRDFMNPLQSQS